MVFGRKSVIDEGIAYERMCAALIMSGAPNIYNELKLDPTNKDIKAKAEALDKLYREHIRYAMDYEMRKRIMKISL